MFFVEPTNDMEREQIKDSKQANIVTNVQLFLDHIITRTPLFLFSLTVNMTSNI